MTPLLIKSFIAVAAIDGYRIVAASGGGAGTASAATDKLLGVSDRLGADAGKMADVILVGWGEVTCGGNVALGDPLTADADGAAIVAEAGAGVRIVGFAMAAGADGDVIPLQVVPGFYHEAAGG